MRLISSIKHQVLVLLVSLTLGLTLVFFALAVTTAFIVEDMLLNNWLSEQARLIERHHLDTKTLSGNYDNSAKVYLDRDALPDWAKDKIAADTISGEIFVPGKEHFHYHQLNLADGGRGYILAEVSGLLVVTKQPGIFLIFLVAFTVSVVLAVWLAVWFSRRLVDPVLSLTRAIAAREAADTKIAFPPLPHELGYLSQTLQTSFDRLQDSLDRERHFSTNVSHELRTPLTVIKNTSSLIAQRGYKPEDLAALWESCVSMENTIDVLLALARSESLYLQKCNIQVHLEQALLRSRLVDIPEVEVDIEVADELDAWANPALLELLFMNLLHNFVEHASEQWLKIEFINDHLIFSNKSHRRGGDFQRAGVKGEDSRGVGQGLYLVHRIAERFGWALSVENVDEHFRVFLALK